MKCRSCGKECVDVGFGNCRECARGDKGKEKNVDEVVKEIWKEICYNRCEFILTSFVAL